MVDAAAGAPDARPKRVALAQVNPTVGDLSGNRRLVEAAAAKAASERADLVVLPEMVLTGSPPMDLLERDGFVRDQLRELDALAAASRRVPIALGAVLPAAPRGGKQLANAAVLLARGEEIARQPKTLLPTYDVFDENRYFVPALSREPVPFEAGALGLSVCEDAWTPEIGYELDPIAELAAAGCGLILNISASPWHVGKPLERRRLFAGHAARTRRTLVFVNQVGGNDELVFDGASCVADARGRILASLPLFEPAFACVDLDLPHTGCTPEGVEEPVGAAQLEAGLVLGIRDYFRKQGLPPGAVVGLSGGVDSAGTAHLAAEALGPDRVLGVIMPGPFSSDHSASDAEALGRNLGIALRKIDIRPLYDAYLEAFRQLLGAKQDYGVAQQNVPARIRGALLMAIEAAEGRLGLAV